MARKAEREYVARVTLELIFNETFTHAQVLARLRALDALSTAEALRELLTYEESILWDVTNIQLQKRIFY